MLAILMTYITCMSICYTSCDVNATIDSKGVNRNIYHMIDESPRISSKQIVECNQQVIENNKNVPTQETTDETYEADNSINSAQSQSTYISETSYDQTYVGTYSITAYTWTGNTMANGEYPYVGCAASCDLPIGTQIYIEGVGKYEIKDVCPTSGVIDIYMNSYDDCITFGRRNAQVYILKNGE